MCSATPCSSSNANDPVENVTLTVTTTDGTQMTYEWKGSAFHCKQVKDRNGNYISITNDSNGNMTQVTDTLGRVITISYDTDNFPTAITQAWNSNNGSGSAVVPPHTWASFSYTTKTLSYRFSAMTAAGPPNATSLKVLDKVT